MDLRKKMYMISVLFLISCNGWKNPENPNPVSDIDLQRTLSDFDLHGEVESFIEDVSKSPTSKPERVVRHFNKDGNLTLVERVVNGKLRPFKEYAYQADGKVYELRKIKAPEKKGEPITMEVSRTCRYGADGRPDRTEFYQDGKLSNYEEYLYSEDGFLSMETRHQISDFSQSKSNYEWMDDGNIKSIQYRSGHTEYEYNGSSVTEKRFSGEKNTWTFEREYDGRHVIHEARTTGSEKEVILMERDSHGNILSYIKQEKGREQKISLSYQYDREGNWLEQIETSEGKIAKRTVRTISYGRRRYLGILP
jgi:hypothetical protein